MRFKRGIKILLIDDVSFFIDLLHKILSSFKFKNIYSATNSKMAMQYLLSKKFDVIFLDLELNNDCGFELFEKIKEAHPDVYVVVFSDSPAKHHVQRALKLGAKGFLKKPFTPNKIIKEVEKFFIAKAIEDRVANQPPQLGKKL